MPTTFAAHLIGVLQGWDSLHQLASSPKIAEEYFAAIAALTNERSDPPGDTCGSYRNREGTQ
jgi:hypothetical protein